MTRVRERAVPVVCDDCGSDLVARWETSDDGTRRRFTLSCPVCGECHTAHQHREPVDAFVSGPEGCGRVTLGSIWATDR